ncbi:hypothetical protein KSS87_017726, partial [Heliosperma pusillum]
MFHFLLNFLPHIVGHVSSYSVRLNQQITSIFPFSRYKRYLRKTFIAYR